MVERKRVSLVALLTILVLLVASCGGGDEGDQAETAGEPEEVELVVHTGPGGGSDVFARAMVELLRDDGIIESNWPVSNRSGGGAAVALGYMVGRSGRNDVIAAMTPTWVATPLTIEEASIKVTDLTPVANLVGEPQVMAVRSDAPFDSLEDFVKAAEESPGELVQTGGSATSADALAAEILKQETGTDWKFLSFESGGDRVAALLGGDADMMISAAPDFTEFVESGELKVVAAIGPERSPLFPDAPTLPESGYDVVVPEQFRGVLGPPDMPQEAVDYYQGVFEELVATDAWTEYAEANGLTTNFQNGEEFGAFLADQEQFLRDILDQLGLLVEE